MKLYHVELEADLYCLAESQAEAERIARRYGTDEELEATAYVATTVNSDWYDALPYHDRPELPDKECSAWLRELNGS